MKPSLMANENFPMPSVAVLRERGYDVLAVAETARSISDQEVLSIAVAESRWVLTFDRDYGELIYARRAPVPPAVLFMRLTSYRPEDPGHLLIEMLENSSQFHGYFVVVEKDGWRKRPLPQR
jgi:predicted nuclease of predicted toxin-antitoxin system